MHRDAKSIGRVSTASAARLAAGVAVLALGLMLMNAEGAMSLLNRVARSAPLAAAQNWCYQLFAVDLKALTTTSCDMLVIDMTDDMRRPYPASVLRQLRTNPDGTRRNVLAYINIGEAEMYRYYWQYAWIANPPEWLVGRNQAWRGNFRVRYWHPEWQHILYKGRQSYLDAIVDADFDGAYLDNVDAYYDLTAENPQAKAQMIALVEEIAKAARARRSGFRIVTQNAEELLASRYYRSTIDAVAKEDLLFGVAGEGIRNRPEDIRHSVAHLQLARQDGKSVFVVEYIDPVAGAAVRDELRQFGFIPYFAERLLDRTPGVLARRPPRPRALSK